MLNFLYNLIIYPLYEVIEVVFLMVFKIFNNYSYAILGVSVAVTILCLPLYYIAEKWQEIEREKQKEMKPGIDRIKSAFKGDEQYMILTTFYKQNHYHPLMALRSSFGLLIQIPFFIAAYTFLSNLTQLQGVSFLFIKDLGAPDATFHIGSFPINILPIAMTLINIASSIIYTKGLSLKEKLPPFIMAFFFLALLYNSPAGLVVYWTMNNVFSLVKNIFYKLKNPLKIFYICICAGCVFIDYFLIFKHTGYLYRRLMLVGVTLIIILIPFILKFINYLLKTIFSELVQNKKLTTTLFFISAATISIFLGFLIPSLVVASSPAEFSFIDDYKSPFFFLFNCTFQVMGLFLFWFSCIYFLFNNKIKALLTILISFLTFACLINAFIFPGNYGLLSPNLQFSDAGVLKASGKTNILNLLTLLIPLALICILTYFKKSKILCYITGIALFSITTISFVNAVTIKKGFNQTVIARESNKTNNSLSPVYHLSKTEKNVVVFMLDRALNVYFPDILEEKPELKDIFQGFTYYPNTLSFGNQTMAGSPPIHGGYDYTPIKMNKNDSVSLVEKHNQSLLVVPRLFVQNGFDVTVSDPSWANYSWVPDLRIYENDPQINVFNAIKNYTDAWLQKNPELVTKNVRSSILKRNFLWYSMLKCLPTMFRDTIYNKGAYWSTNKDFNDIQDVLSNYAVLDLLPELTDFSCENKTYTYIVNELTHEPTFLQSPDYIPSKNPVNPQRSKQIDEAHYDVNMAAFLRIAKWINYLKENDAYDNTRIIIVSDHGFIVPNDRFNSSFPEDASWFNSILLVKDFNEQGQIKEDNSFMTGADVPSLSMKDLINNPVNPNTNNPINMDGKKDGIIVVNLEAGTPGFHHTNTFKFSENSFRYVKDDITNPDNWKNVTEEEAFNLDN